MKPSLCLLLTTLACLDCAAHVRGEDLVNATAARLKSDLSFLASDELAGRDVGSPGITRAGDFVAERFASLGLQTDLFDGTPFQEFTIPGPAALGPGENNRLVFSSQDGESQITGELGQDFMSLSLGSNGTFSGEVAFVGYGISAPELDYDDYAGLDVQGKVVIALRKEPQQNQADSVFDGLDNSQYAYFTAKELNAALHGVAALILVNDAATAEESDEIMDATSAGSAGSERQVPTLFVKRAILDPVLKQATGKTLAELEMAIDKDLTPQSQLLSGITAEGETLIEDSKIPARNVLGLLPGSGSLADEYVVVGAHYDHVGMGGQGSLAPGTIEVHNGADDNASGTTTLMEVARRMAADQSENRRSLVFMAFSAEEKGLLGSKYYVRHPRFPLEDTVAMINMDMVGRLRDNRLTIFGTGTATGFDALVERLNEESQFVLEKQAAGFGPSDHSSFYEQDIPVFHFFTGLHNQYHRPSDDIDTVNYDGMARIAGMITATVREIATAAEAPEHVKISSFADVGRSRPRPTRAVLGIQLDLDGATSGAGVSSVQTDSPADKAGLQDGDVIIQIDEEPIGSVRDLRRILGNKQPGDTIKVRVTRGAEEMELTVKLGQG